MDVTDSIANVAVTQGEEPPFPTRKAIRKVATKHLDKHHVSKVFRHKSVSWKLFAQFMTHPLQGPSKSRPTRVISNMHDRWENAEQDIGVMTGQSKMATGQEEFAASIVDSNAPTAHRRKNCFSVNGRK